MRLLGTNIEGSRSYLGQSSGPYNGVGGVSVSKFLYFSCKCVHVEHLSCKNCVFLRTFVLKWCKILWPIMERPHIRHEPKAQLLRKAQTPWSQRLSLPPSLEIEDTISVWEANILQIISMFALFSVGGARWQHSFAFE